MSSSSRTRITKVLVLNQDYTALSICTAPKAFLMVYMNKAELITEDEQRKIRTVDTDYPHPSIIRLNRYVNLPYRGGVVLNRSNILKRDGHTCQYCGSGKDLTIDHVIPRAQRGPSTWTNLVTACRSCNTTKGSMTPEEADMPLRQIPYKPSFVMFMRDFTGKVRDDWKIYLGKRKN